ncbi:baeRF7 domain-containing protein [Dyadobacter sandarakinus]|uniref:Uncharacterized protein n=1 Tax=Dyadobacter sandarakinus TaxID=2747268 RepID=A0ABX7I542_9BACT|nr:hypothetical protein [Dyadobacter sandarakinus]QRR00652.1 hypothetical protein HWI92_06885 [Dyadobacter sandarakinus]
MGKDQSGGFHPPKGQPSGANKQEGLGISTTPPEQLEDYLQRTDEYVVDDETLDPSLPVRNPNRHMAQPDGGRANLREKDKTIELAIDSDVDTVPEELPGILSKEMFTELADYESDCCISIYLPTHQSGVAVNEKQDAILFKNTLKDLSATLTEKGIDPARVKQLLTPGFELLQQDTFWANMGQGLGIFIAENYFRYVKMPVTPQQHVSSATRFFVAPLVPTLASKEYFFLLVISKHRCQLFKADAFSMKPVDVEGLPEDMMSVKRISEKDASTVRIGVSSGGSANFHGMAGGNPDEKDNIAVYFEAVDDILFKEVLNKENAPLLLAGVEYLIPIYRSACDYHNVCKEALTGSHEHDELHALYAQAREIMAPYFRKPQETAATMFANQSATPLTNSMPEGVIPAAYYGRISHLFAAKGEQVWGTFNETTSELKLHAQQQDDSEDLLNRAVVKTLANGGEAFLVEPDEMPSEGPLAAVLRY